MFHLIEQKTLNKLKYTFWCSGVLITKERKTHKIQKSRGCTEFFFCGSAHFIIYSLNYQYITYSLPATKVIKCDYNEFSCPEGVGSIMKKTVNKLISILKSDEMQR